MASAQLFLASLLVVAVNCTTITGSVDSHGNASGSMNTSKQMELDITPSVRASCNANQNPPKNRVNTTDQLRRLRLSMKGNSYSAYVIPSFDEHQSEYVPAHAKRMQFISGFSGSSGTAVVLLEDAAMWTDSRYFIQAGQELDCNWSLMKIGEKNVPTISEWLSKKLTSGSIVGVDPKIITELQWTTWKKVFEEKGISLSENNHNLIDDIWSIGVGRPTVSHAKIFVHELKYTGKPWKQKVSELREALGEKGIDGAIISILDEVAWLFNLRGYDVSFVPVFESYAFVSQKFLRLYVKESKLSERVRRHLESDGCDNSTCVKIKKYNDTFDDLRVIIKECGKILVTNYSSHALVDLVPKDKRVVENIRTPIMDLRAVKNAVEIEGMKNAHLKDAVAVVDFVSQLDEEVTAGKHWDEIKASKRLAKFRSEQELNYGESFKTISASGLNAAIVHYVPLPSTNRYIDTKSTYLLDSGGQYLDGTTDVTRTFHFGEPTNFEKEVYTRVLMGSINLLDAVFPEGTRDMDLNIIAYLPLTEVGLAYLHGTGHGIGHFLSVHEAPVLISNPATRTDSGCILKPGMFISNEPGYYELGEFGIRLETTMLVVKAHTPYESNITEFYTFEPIAVLPYEPKLIKLELLSENQKSWLNDYNTKIKNYVGTELKNQKRMRAYKWLLSKTKYIPIPMRECTNGVPAIVASSFISILIVGFSSVIIL